MCEVCNRVEDAKFEEWARLSGEIYVNERLETSRMNVGVMGEFVNELNLIVKDDETFLETCFSLNNDADICKIARIQIEFCPFCGRKLAD